MNSGALRLAVGSAGGVLFLAALGAWITPLRLASALGLSAIGPLALIGIALAGRRGDAA